MVTVVVGLCERCGPTRGGGRQPWLRCHAIGPALSGFERFSDRLKAKVSSSKKYHGGSLSPTAKHMCTCLSENHHFY